MRGVKYVPPAVPTLLDYYLEGYRHLRIECPASLCFAVGTVEIAQYLGRRRNRPVNLLNWTCPTGHRREPFRIRPVEQTRCDHCTTANIAARWR